RARPSSTRLERFEHFAHLNGRRSLPAPELHNEMAEFADRYGVAGLDDGRRCHFFDDRGTRDDISPQQLRAIVHRRLERPRALEKHRANAAARTCRRPYFAPGYLR